MRRQSARLCVKKVLKGLEEFGFYVEIDPKTYEVLGVRSPKRSSQNNIN